MLQYKIPQDVQIEDKILGPMTLKQLLIVATGGGTSYTLFLVITKYYYIGIFEYFWIAIPFLLSLAFAFLRINDVSFLKWLLLLYEFGHNSRRRKWDKTETSRLHFSFVTAKTGTDPKKNKTTEKKEQKTKDVPGKKKFSSLEELTQVLDHSPISTVQVQDDHEHDEALHLSQSEKKRHEQRLDELISQNITSQPEVKEQSKIGSQKTKVPEVAHAQSPATNVVAKNILPQKEIQSASNSADIATPTQKRDQKSAEENTKLLNNKIVQNNQQSSINKKPLQENNILAVPSFAQAEKIISSPTSSKPKIDTSLVDIAPSTGSSSNIQTPKPEGTTITPCAQPSNSTNIGVGSVVANSELQNANVSQNPTSFSPQSKHQISDLENPIPQSPDSQTPPSAPSEKKLYTIHKQEYFADLQKGSGEINFS